jgi:hypothetical protein
MEGNLNKLSIQKGEISSRFTSDKIFFAFVPSPSSEHQSSFVVALVNRGLADAV